MTTIINNGQLIMDNHEKNNSQLSTINSPLKKGYKQTEIGVIPMDWDVAKLGDLGEIKMCKRVFNYQTKKDGPIPFYKIGTFGKDPNAFIAKELYDEYRRKFSFPRKGDILISAAGTLGRTVVYDGKPSYFQDSNIVWIDNHQKDISNSFLYYLLQVISYTTEGSTIQRLYNSIIENALFAKPSTSEEADAIATVLSDTDALIENLEKLIAKKKAIKQGAMQQLLTGKKRLPGFSREWEMKKLGEVAVMNSGGTPSSKIKKYYGGNVLWVSIADMTKVGKYISDTEKKLTELGLANSSARIFPEKTVLYAMYASIGECCIALSPVSTSQAILGIRCDNQINNIFLYYYLTSIKDQVKLLGQQGTQSNLNKGMVENFELNLPRIEEQTAIATVLSDMDAEIESLEKSLSKYRQIKTGMMQQLLTGKIRLL